MLQTFLTFHFLFITFCKDEVLRRKQNDQVKTDFRVKVDSTMILLINIQMISLCYLCYRFL